MSGAGTFDSRDAQGLRGVDRGLWYTGYDQRDLGAQEVGQFS